MLKFLVLLSLLAITVATNVPPLLKVIYEWKFIQYNWPPESQLNQHVNRFNYIEADNAIAGIKLWKDKIYLTIPRWRNGVPVTLAVTSAIPLNNVTDPMLDPYPNWDMQALSNCSAFQSVQSMEIDPLGRMWVLDTGRTDTMTSNPVARCPPRLVILDLENNGTILRSYEFPENVTRRQSTYLNDIVLDHQDGGWAFITDSEDVDPGIIVYSLRDNKSWKFRDDSMRAKASETIFRVANTQITKAGNVDGIALSPPGANRQLYYSPISSLHLYSVPVWVLKDGGIEQIGDWIIDLGLKISQTDGMIMTNQGSLYLGLLAEDMIAVWNRKSNPSFSDALKPFVKDHKLLQWQDTFAIDEEGRLWTVSNRLQNFMSNQVNISEPNYRIICSPIGQKNYQYFENGTAPKLPSIDGGASHSTISLLSLICSSIFVLLVNFQTVKTT